MPYILSWIGIFLMVACAGVGSAAGTVMAGSATVGALKKRDDIFPYCLILSAMPGTQGLYGFGAFFILQSKITMTMNLLQASAIFAAGLIMGMVGLISAIYQAKIVSNGIESLGNGNNVFSNTLILGVLPELYAIIAFASSFLISGMVDKLV